MEMETETMDNNDKTLQEEKQEQQEKQPDNLDTKTNENNKSDNKDNSKIQNLDSKQNDGKTCHTQGGIDSKGYETQQSRPYETKANETRGKMQCLTNREHTSMKSFMKTNDMNSKYNHSFLNTNVNNIRAYGMSNVHSGSSLQKSVNAISFTKSSRFHTQAGMENTGGLYNLVTTPRHQIGCGIGYGKKTDVHTNILHLMKNPSPFDYNVKSGTDLNLLSKKGVTIGIKTAAASTSNLLSPGPDAYKIEKNHQSHIPISIRSRLSYFYDLDLKQKAHCISPQKYLPGMNTQEPNRFDGAFIGYGNRVVGKTADSNPGVGSYNLPSVFDKNRRTNKYPLN